MTGSKCTTCRGIVLETIKQAKADAEEVTPAKEAAPAQAAGEGIIAVLPQPAHLAAPVKLLWPIRQVFQVWFLNGDKYPEHVALVKDTVREWEKYAKVSFTFPSDWNPNSPPEVRLRFWVKPEGFEPENEHQDVDDGHWSFIGLDCKYHMEGNKQPNFWEPTMSLHPDDLSEEAGRVVFRGIILHEFGHTLGFMHEHQRPDGEAYLKYDMNKIYEYYKRDQDWDEADVKNQVLNFHEYRGKSDVVGNKFDTKSIMMYDVPKEILLPGYPAIPRNNVLSDGDKKFVGRLYPENVRTLWEPVEIIPDPMPNPMPNP